jgi:hypothetical protein
MDEKIMLSKKKLEFTAKNNDEAAEEIAAKLRQLDDSHAVAVYNYILGYMSAALQAQEREQKEAAS